MPNCFVVKDFFMVELKMRICQAHIQYTHINVWRKCFESGRLSCICLLTKTSTELRNYVMKIDSKRDIIVWSVFLLLQKQLTAMYA